MALRGARWVLVCAVTLAVCGVTAVMGGLWLLPLWIKDGAAVWGVATALGVAVSAPIPLWGQGYANRSREEKKTVTASGERSVAVGGPIEGNISTGDTGTSTASLGGAPAGTSAPAPVAPVAPGSVTASGGRAVAASGPVKGNISTGDRSAPEPQP